jgi:hypothetical protein
MGLQELSRKKQIETNYIEEARRASSIFPIGELVPHEKPDFLLHTDSGTIGIDVTELSREEPRAEAGRLMKVPGKAHVIYNGLANVEPVGVFVIFSKQAENVRFDALTTSLAEFVYAHRSSAGHFYKKDYKDLPEGYFYIGIEAWTPTARWHSGRSSDTTRASRGQLESLIAKKNQRVRAYRLSAPSVWLLIVNDLFLGPGEVYARPDDLAKWKFTFDFDKVLLFSRQPGGGGDVIEIQRA